MPVNSTHPDYDYHAKQWEVVRDCIKSDVRKHLLPIEFGKSPRVLARNKKYMDMAIFNNFTLNTLYGLVGTALLKGAEIELPPELEFMREGSTGDGLTIEQLIRKSLGEVVQMGRYALLSDFPDMALGLTAEQVTQLQPLPHIYSHNAEDVMNWGYRYINGVQMVDFVVIREHVYARDKDGYKWQEYAQYRVLQLDDNNDFFYNLVDGDSKVLTDDLYPMVNGKRWKKIPITFIGSEDNNLSVDVSPLFPIAHVNIGHYRNSASLEDNADAHSQGTLAVTSSLNASQWEAMNKGRPLVMGSREGYFLGQSGSMTLVQLPENQLSMKMMEQKEEQMIMLGAHLMTSANANAPVETTRMQLGAKISRLATIVDNVEAGITNALRDCAEYLGANPDLVKISMSREFIQESADPVLMQALAAQWQTGAIPLEILHDYSRKVNIIPRETTTEELISQIGKESPLGTGDGFGGNTPTEFGNPNGVDVTPSDTGA